MKRRQRRALAAYVRETMDVLAMPHWKLILAKERPDHVGPDAEGYCSPVFGQHTALMWFDPELPQQLPSRARYIVVHEILHIPLHACWEAWDGPCSSDGLLSEATYNAITKNGVRAWEMCIDQIARAFAALLPMIDWDAKPDADWIPKDADVDELHIASRMWRDAGHETPGG